MFASSERGQVTSRNRRPKQPLKHVTPIKRADKGLPRRGDERGQVTSSGGNVPCHARGLNLHDGNVVKLRRENAGMLQILGTSRRWCHGVRMSQTCIVMSLRDGGVSQSSQSYSVHYVMTLIPRRVNAAVCKVVAPGSHHYPVSSPASCREIRHGEPCLPIISADQCQIIPNPAPPGPEIRNPEPECVGDSGSPEYTV